MKYLLGENLSKVYGKREVVKNVTISVRTGEVVGLLGPNGAGKTTSFYMLIGEISPSSGRVILNDKEITFLAMYQRVRLGIGYLPQESSVFRGLTAEQNIEVALDRRSDLTPSQKKELLNQLLEEFGLAKVRKNLSSTLSGGEKRRLEVARACALAPQFFLLDEPFAGIDPLAIKDIQAIIKQLKEKGLGILVTDHNVRETLKVCDRAYILVDGRVITEGYSEEVVKNEDAIKYYLGEQISLK